jgi:hypothetical protein
MVSREGLIRSGLSIWARDISDSRWGGQRLEWVVVRSEWGSAGQVSRKMEWKGKEGHREWSGRGRFGLSVGNYSSEEGGQRVDFFSSNFRRLMISWSE